MSRLGMLAGLAGLPIGMGGPQAPGGADGLSAMMAMLQQQMEQQQADIADGPNPEEAILDLITPDALAEAARDSWDRMQPTRDVRAVTIEKFVGPYYPNATSEEPEYINLLQQVVETMLPQLVATDPKSNVEATASSLTIEALVRQLVLNRECRRCELGEIHFDAVLDALFAPYAVVAVGLKAGLEQVQVENKRFSRGQFYVELIDLEDYLIDQSARRLSEASFEGHRFRIPRSVALAAEISPGVPMYNREIVRNMPRLTTSKEQQAEAQRLGGESGDPYELLDLIEMWQIAVYAGDKTIVYTLSSLSGGERAWVREPFEWWGRGRGPYRKMLLGKTPANAMPIPYATRVLDLHEAGQTVVGAYVKAVQKSKAVNIVAPGEEDLAEAVANADHEEYIKGNPSSIVTVKSSGVIPEMQPGIQAIMEMFNNASGSSQLLGGQKDISKTATAASILQGNAQQRIRTMKFRSMAFLTEIINDMAWYMDNDPFLQATVVARLPGGVNVELTTRPENRKGRYNDFTFSVNAFASDPIDPMVKLDKLIQAIGTLPGLMQLGPQPMSKILQVYAKALEEPVLDEINPDPSQMIARESLVAAEGPKPKDDPVGGPKKIDRAPRPYDGVLSQARSSQAGGRVQSPVGV